MPYSCPRNMSLWQVIKNTFTEWSEDNASTLAAALTYYAIFSIGPMLIIAIAIVSFFYGHKAAQDQVRPQLAQFVGERPAEFMQDLLHRAAISPGFSIAGIISVVLLLYAATNVFAALQSALNTIFDVEPKPGRGITGMIKDRAMTFLMVMLIGAFVLASIVLNTVLAGFTKWGANQFFPNHPAVAGFLLEAVSFLVSALVFTGVFAAIFKYLPDVKIDWKDTFIGAAATAVLFSLARIGLGYYLSRGSTAGPFGAAGSLVIVMLFIYYSSQILFLGAEFTQVWACRSGHPINPSDNAVALSRKADRRKERDRKKGSSVAAGGGGRRANWWPAGRSTPAAIDPQKERPLDTAYPAERFHPPMS